MVDVNALQEEMRQRVEAFRDEIHGMIAKLAAAAAGVAAGLTDEPTPPAEPAPAAEPAAEPAEPAPADVPPSNPATTLNPPTTA